MAAHHDVAMTAIHRFIQVATAADYSSEQSIDCCGDVLTYGQLLALVEKFAAELHSKFGDRPVVSFVSENHPYVLISILATWLLGGVIAPLDYHAPEALLRGMLEGVHPTCIILPDTAVGNIAIVKDMGLTALPFVTSESGIPSLLQKFSVGSNNVPTVNTRLLPHPEDDAIYLYTSSASSIANLKCVPINHGTLYSNASLELETWRIRRNIPVEARPERFRVLGWGPFSHIMSLANDFTCHCIIPVGCYIFGVPPSTYPISESSAVSRPVQGQSYDVGAILLRTAYRAKADMISGVPWLYKQIKEECSRNPHYLDFLKDCRQLLSGGALTDDEVQKWAEEHGLKLDVSIGMTELSGALFEVGIETMLEGGYPIKEVLVTDATLTLLDEEGVESDSYGELIVRSKYISKGYRNFKSSSHVTDENGVTTFSTGDIYSCINGRLMWQGRREDYIQLGSAELLDPRVPERELSESSSIARVALVGDKFLKGAADVVCAIVEPSEDGFKPQEILRAFAAVNKTLHPPLRVPASRILVLPEGEKIPMTRKGLIWRKALEERFGERLKALLDDPKLSRFREVKKEVPVTQSLEEIESEIAVIIAEGLGISRELLEENRDSSFAELGMDSNMATRIVSKLNNRFGLDFPMSACHDYVDLPQLAAAISDKLNQKRGVISKTLTPQIINTSDDDVVIVGQAFRLPGSVNDEHAFWKALVEKINVLQHMGNDRWDHESFYVPPGSTTKPQAGSINFTQMGRIEVASYDNAFFGISPAEAYFVTPGARCALEVSVEALEDANIPLSSIKGSNLAVFVAQGPEFGYPDLIYTEKGFEVYDRYYGTGVADSAISGRLSYFLDVHGPSVTLNTACSGGLVALDNALMAIRYGACETAIVCSVNVHVWPGNFGFLSANQMSSLHGRCATFSKDADGYVPSEGAMAFIVKSKRAALRDGDNILGVVKSTSVQHNGRSQGLVAPNSKAQAALQRSVLAAAGLTPADIDFVENHGTGTILGDMMEIQAINEVFSGSHTTESPLVLGAAKTIFGHTESSAGLVGVAKALQTLRHHIVPGLAHLNGENLSPRIDTTVTPLRISHLSTDLKHRSQTTPLRALSLSFGFAGTIAAVVLEEYLSDRTNGSTRQIEAPSRPIPHLFVVSAKTEKALLEYIKSYVEFCSTAQESDLADICYTSCIGREHYRFRFACTCSSLKELVDNLNETLLEKKPIPAILSKPRVAFAFPGQGTQWQGMGRSFSDLDKTFASYLMDYAEQASSLLGTDLASLLFEPANADDKRSSINETHISQSCIFVFQCAMAKWLSSFGIVPNGTIAHSLGEIAAAVSAKSMEFRTALEFIVARSNAMRPERTNGGLMAAIRAPIAPITKRINSLGLSSSVTIAAYNSDTQNVVSGDEASVRKLVDDLSMRSIKGTVLSVNQGFHSHCIDNALGPIHDHCEGVKEQQRNPNIPYYSSVEGRALKVGDRLDSDYWVKQARQPVRFVDAARSLLDEKKFHVVVDIGPQNVISHLLKDAASRASSNISISSLCDRPATDSLNPSMQTIATLYKLGITPDFQSFYSGRRVQARKIAVPTYPWQRQRHYPSIIPSRTSKIKGSESSEAYSRTWKIGKELGHLLEKDHTLNSVPIVPAAALAMFVSLEAKKMRGVTTLVDMRISKPILLEELEEEELRIDIKGSNFTCTHIRHASDKAVVCSGVLKTVAVPQTIDTSGSRDTIMDKVAIYEKFKTNLVKFGEGFQCIQAIEVTSNAAVGRIEVPSSGNSQHDFVRKMDAVFHMFGAIAPEGPPELRASGNFLPSALNGLALYSESFPEIFTCTYRLPIKVAPSNKMMTAELQVRSEAGDILLSCSDYIVSWIPSSGPVARAPAPKGSLPLLKTEWTSKSLSTHSTTNGHLTSAELVYIGSGISRKSLESICKERSISFSVVDDTNAFFNATQCKLCSQSSSSVSSHCLQCKKREGSCYIVYDTTTTDLQISEASISSSSLGTLDVLKKLSPHLRSRTITSAVVLTQNSLHVDIDDISDKDESKRLESGSLLGSIAHGMVRVLRQECASLSVSAIDLPNGISSHDTGACILNELTGSSNSRTSPVVYRYSKESQLLRLESRLVEDGYWAPVIGKRSSGSRGIAVVVGMGEFGTELIKQLIDSAEWSTIAILNERPQSDIQIASTLIDIEVDGVELQYEQVDVASYDAVRSALLKIAGDSRQIHCIIHTAGVSKSTLVETTSERDMNSVLRYKALGSWNLHSACEELKISVDRFVMLSSVSVTLGKAGHVSTVAGCSFMDELARYRSAVCSGKSYSIQVGAWESAKGTDDSQEIIKISYDLGLPLLLSTLRDIDLPVVPILAKLQFSALRGKGVYSSDPFFASTINLISASEPLVASTASAKPVTVTTTTAVSSKVSSPGSIGIPSVQKFVASSLQKILGLSATDMENLDSSTPVLSLGIDSISFTQLRADVADKFEVDVPMSFLGEETLTLVELSEFIVDAAKEQRGSETSETTESDTVVAERDFSSKDAEKFIAESLKNVLGMTAADMENFDSSTPILSLGIDSISFTQLRADVLKKYNVDIPMTFLGEDSLTLSELADFTVEKASE